MLSLKLYTLSEEKNEVNEDKKEYVKIQLCDSRGIPIEERKEVEIPKVVFML